MTNKFEKYRADNIASSMHSSSIERFEKYRYKPNEENDVQINQSNQAPSIDYKNQLKSIQSQHPYLYKLAELLQKTPGLEKAGNIAGTINRTVEQTGLPSAAKGFLGSGIEMGRGLTNLIPGVNIEKQEYPELFVQPHFGKVMEIAGGLSMGVPAYGAYKGAKAGIEALPYVKNMPELIKNLLAGGASGAALSPDARGLGAGLGAGFSIIPDAAQKMGEFFNTRSPKVKQQELINALIREDQEKNYLKGLTDEALVNYKTSNPNLLINKAAEKEKQLKAAQMMESNLIGEHPALPGNQTVSELEHHYKNMNEHLAAKLGAGKPNTQKLSKEIVDQIKGIEVFEPHPVTGIPRLVRKGGLQQEIGQKYDALENDLPNLLEIPSPKFSQEINKELEKLSKGITIEPQKVESLKKILAASHPGKRTEPVAARDYFRSYRSLRQLEGTQRNKAYGLGPKEHDEWIDKANHTKKTYEDMEKVINTHFPKDITKKLAEINHEYSSLIAPLNDNPIFQQMLKHGNYKGNLIEALSGTTSGNYILNNLIKTNPELSTLLIGKEFAHQPHKLLSADDITKDYIQTNPEISNLIGKQLQLHQGLESAKSNAKLFDLLPNKVQLQNEILNQQKLAHEIKLQLERVDLSKADKLLKQEQLNKIQKKTRGLIKKVLGGAATTAVGAATYYLSKKILE